MDANTNRRRRTYSRRLRFGGDMDETFCSDCILAAAGFKRLRAAGKRGVGRRFRRGILGNVVPAASRTRRAARADRVAFADQG